LRLLDNDELSPDEVNDVKDLVEDYLDRNQDDFDEFEDVDDIYEALGKVPDHPDSGAVFRWFS
jgi:CCR4-NOT transcription complex subunit 3